MRPPPPEAAIGEDDRADATPRSPARPAPDQPPKPPRQREIELKFTADDATMAALAQAPILGDGAFGRPRRLVSTYFDTPDGALERAGYALRMRPRGKRWLMGLKWLVADGDLAARGEIEAIAPTATPDFGLFAPETAERLSALVGAEPLVARFSSQIRRATRMVAAHGATFEIALDTGAIIAGAARAAVREIEIELRSGPVEAIHAFALDLARQAPLRLLTQTKAERGRLLAAGLTPRVARAPSAPLAGAAMVDDAIAAVITACIRHFTANWPAFLIAERPESVHQMRVALRRLRSMLGLFARAFPSGDLVALRSEAKRLATALGDARDLDVFAEMLRNGPGLAFPGDPGLATLEAATAARRREAYAAARTTLEDPATTLFVLSAGALIARRGWRGGLTAEDLMRLVAPPAPFAAQRLARLDRKVRRRGRGLMEQTVEERHQVRIALKGLRYAAEFFTPLFDKAGAAKAYGAAAGRLQDTLGLANDAAMAGDILHRLALDPADHNAARGAGLVLGWLARGAMVDGDSVEADWRSFKRAKRFWA